MTCGRKGGKERRSSSAIEVDDPCGREGWSALVIVELGPEMWGHAMRNDPAQMCGNTYRAYKSPRERHIKCGVTGFIARTRGENTHLIQNCS